MFLIVFRVSSSRPVIQTLFHLPAAHCNTSFLHLLLTCRLNSGVQIRSLFVFLFWVSWMFGIHHGRSPHVSSDFSLLPLLLSLFLLFPLRLYRRRSERWEVSLPIPLIYCLPAVLNLLPHFLSFYFLLPLHLLLPVSQYSFHLYGSTSTSLSSLLSFFLYLPQNFWIFLILSCSSILSFCRSCSLSNSPVPPLLSSQVFSKLLEPVTSRLAWPVSLLPSLPSGATLGLGALSPLNNNYKKSK